MDDHKVDRASELSRIADFLVSLMTKHESPVRLDHSLVASPRKMTACLKLSTAPPSCILAAALQEVKIRTHTETSIQSLKAPGMTGYEKALAVQRKTRGNVALLV